MENPNTNLLKNNTLVRLKNTACSMDGVLARVIGVSAIYPEVKFYILQCEDYVDVNGYSAFTLISSCIEVVEEPKIIRAIDIRFQENMGNCVLAEHKPTGIQEFASQGRSFYQNRKSALEGLKNKLFAAGWVLENV